MFSLSIAQMIIVQISILTKVVHSPLVLHPASLCLLTEAPLLANRPSFLFTLLTYFYEVKRVL